MTVWKLNRKQFMKLRNIVIICVTRWKGIGNFLSPTTQNQCTSL